MNAYKQHRTLLHNEFLLPDLRGSNELIALRRSSLPYTLGFHLMIPEDWARFEVHNERF